MEIHVHVHVHIFDEVVRRHMNLLPIHAQYHWQLLSALVVDEKVHWFCLDALHRLEPCSLTASCTLIANSPKPASWVAFQFPWPH